MPSEPAEAVLPKSTVPIREDVLDFADETRKELSRLFEAAKHYDILSENLRVLLRHPEFEEAFFHHIHPDPRKNKFGASIMIADMQSTLIELEMVKNIVNGFLELAEKHFPEFFPKEKD